MADIINKPLSQFRWDNLVLQRDNSGNWVFTRYYQEAFSDLYNRIQAVPSPAALDLLSYAGAVSGPQDGLTDSTQGQSRDSGASLDDARIIGLDVRPSADLGLDGAISMPGSWGKAIPDIVIDMLLSIVAPRPAPAQRFFLLRDTIANQGNYPPAQFFEGYYIATDTRITYYSDGASWIQIDPWDDAYGAGWNGSLKAPTQNAVYDAIQALGASYPSVSETIAMVAQSAAIAPRNFAGVSAPGTYRLNYYLEDTASDITAGTIQLSVAFTDDSGATTVTSTALALTALGRTSGIFFIQLASGSIAWQTVAVGIFGTAQYALYQTLERLS